MYYDRLSKGQAVNQEGDSKSYKQSIVLYNKWMTEEQESRKMQLFAVGLMATPALLSTSPAILISSLRVKLTANVVAAGADFGIQALMNVSNNRSILQNWNPVATGTAFLLGTSSHSLSNIAGVSLINSTFSTSINLSLDARNNGSIFSFDPSSIIINAVFGTAVGFSGNQLKVDFRNLSLGEGASQSINLAGAAVDDKK
jgi:hypothetical protein